MHAIVFLSFILRGELYKQYAYLPSVSYGNFQSVPCLSRVHSTCFLSQSQQNKQMNLKLASYSNSWGLEVPSSYTPPSNCFIASNMQDIRFLFHYCPYAFASVILYIHCSLAQNTSSCQLTWYACRCEFQHEKGCHADNRYISTFWTY